MVALDELAPYLARVGLRQQPRLPVFQQTLGPVSTAIRTPARGVEGALFLTLVGWVKTEVDLGRLVARMPKDAPLVPGAFDLDTEPWDPGLSQRHEARDDEMAPLSDTGHRLDERLDDLEKRRRRDGVLTKSAPADRADRGNVRQQFGHGGRDAFVEFRESPNVHSRRKQGQFHRKGSFLVQHGHILVRRALKVLILLVLGVHKNSDKGTWWTRPVHIKPVPKTHGATLRRQQTTIGPPFPVRFGHVGTFAPGGFPFAQRDTKRGTAHHRRRVKHVLFHLQRPKRVLVRERRLVLDCLGQRVRHEVEEDVLCCTHVEECRWVEEMARDVPNVLVGPVDQFPE